MQHSSHKASYKFINLYYQPKLIFILYIIILIYTKSYRKIDIKKWKYKTG